jgi:hypothetical protein
MKYFGQPQCHIIDYEKGKEVFCFNENGEYETEDEKLIQWMKKNKNFIRHEETKVTTDDLIKCKKCEFTCSNKGELMQHYKHVHPKKE